MTFEEALDQALAMLHRRRRVTYGTLQLQFGLDAERLEALKDALLFAHAEISDEDDRGLIWTGDIPDPAQNAQPETDGETRSRLRTSRSSKPFSAVCKAAPIPSFFRFGRFESCIAHFHHNLHAALEGETVAASR